MPRKRSNTKGSGISKSQAVRDYLTDHPHATAREIGPAVKAAHGIDISPQMINTIKSNFRKHKGGLGRKGGMRSRGGGMRGRGGRPRSNGAGITVEELLAAKKLAQDLGGIPRAQEALTALSRLS